MSKNIPALLISTIVGYLILSPWLPLEAKTHIYALSLCIKSLIIAVLPCIIFCLITRAIVQLQHGKATLIPLILSCIVISNFISTWISKCIGSLVYALPISVALPAETTGLLPSFTCSIPQLFSNDKAMIAGIIAGIVCMYIPTSYKNRFIHGCSTLVSLLLTGITAVISPFILGSIIKLHYDGNLWFMCKEYAGIFIIIACALTIYIFLLYYVSQKGNLNRTWSALHNMFPAAITGLTSMSSAAALPLSIMATEQNKGRSGIAPSIIPVTVNFHLVGDCFAIPILAYAILKNFGCAEPTLYEYLLFSIYFVLAKFSVAAVPGGGIIVMLPVLEQYLHFNTQMLSLITALYILFDPIITCANVLANGAFALLTDNIIISTIFPQKETR